MLVKIVGDNNTLKFKTFDYLNFSAVYSEWKIGYFSMAKLNNKLLCFGLKVGLLILLHFTNLEESSHLSQSSERWNGRRTNQDRPYRGKWNGHN